MNEPAKPDAIRGIAHSDRAGRGREEVGDMQTTDMGELRWWFAEEPPAAHTGHLAAQSYEPRGSGVYDPTTDYRLERLVQDAKNRRDSPWMRVKRIVDRVAELPNGRELVDVLRRAFGMRNPFSVAFEFGEVAIGTPTLFARAMGIARELERERLLEVALISASRSRLSPMTVAHRVFETDEHLTRGGFAVTEEVLRAGAARALRDASSKQTRDDAFLEQVRLETEAVVDPAIAAYRAARVELGATKAESRAARAQANASFLDELLDEKAAKEAARFEARLRRVS